jgi:hypothetical protein
MLPYLDVCILFPDCALTVDLRNLDRSRLIWREEPPIEDYEERTAEERSVEVAQPVVVEKGPGER